MRIFIVMITLTAVAALSIGCSSRSPDSAIRPTHSAMVTTPAATPTAANGTTSTPPIAAAAPPTAATSTATGSNFCAAVRRVGLDNLGIAQAPGSAPNHLLPNLDKLDAIAPAAIRADFDRFTKLEHALLAKTKPEPAVLANLNSPDVTRSLRHVGDYLRINCGIETS